MALACGATSAPAANVSVSVFYDSLEPYGEWFETPDYGYVWHPRNVDDNWRPYTEGNWAYTDSGWTWVSEEPFGWATYHYGRWIEIDRVGWTWVPDREWGPAWVSWRRSEQHVGWAPLPPEARFEARVGFHDWTDSYYDIGPTYYSFVKVRDFGAPRLRTVIVEPRENLTIIRETRNITNITYVNNVVFNEGPRYDVIVRETAQPIRRLKIERRTDIDYRTGGDRNRFAAQVQGDVLRIAAPEVEVTREARPAKLGQRLERVDVDRGWKRAGDAQAVEQFRTRVAAETKAPAELPPTPKLTGSDRPVRANRPPSTTAEATTPDATPIAPAREGKGKGRTPAVAETAPTPDAEKPAKGPARERAPKEKPAVAVRPEPDATRPNANVERERLPNRPDARENAEPPVPRPEGEKMKKRGPAAPEAPAIEPDRTPREPRPEAERPDRKARPDAALDRPARPERPAPPAPAEDREPKRKGPPAGEDRSPDRVRPEAADRSPENRPGAPDARPEATKKRGGGKPEKPADDGAADEKKKKD